MLLWHLWSELVAARGDAMQGLEVSVRQWRLRAVAEALRTWSDTVTTRSEARTALQAALARWQKTALTAALAGWVAATQRMHLASRGAAL